MFVLLAAVIRLIVPLGAFVAHGNPAVFSKPDTGSYMGPAEALVTTGRFTTHPGGSPEIGRTPGYPLLLMLGIVAGRITIVTIAAQILLGAGTVWGVALLARRLCAPLDAGRVMTQAAALLAFDPLSILYPSLLLSETLFTAMFVAHLCVLLRFLDTGATGTAAFAGLLAAASTFVRPAAYYWPYVVVVIMLWAVRKAGVRGVRGCAAFLVLAVLPCLAWEVRNDVQAGYGGFSAIRDRNLYAWNAAGVLARTNDVPIIEVRARLDARLADLEGAGVLDTPARQADYMAREGLRVLLEHPATSLEVHLMGVARVLVGPGFTPYLNLYTGRSFSGFELAADPGRFAIAALVGVMQQHQVFLVGSLVFMAILLLQIGCAGLGVVRVWSRRTGAAWVLLGAAAYFLLIAGGPAGYSRFRHPVMPAICAFAAIGLGREPREGLKTHPSVARQTPPTQITACGQESSTGPQSAARQSPRGLHLAGPRKQST